ncbi:enoyl-CoA hydratase/isomerase family protein [Amycolatopsis sp. PS_44_ISF1]|uniref:enoyl-CoA hydratase/isomerase family protein n=1 Tax=Amycolatopsis sp. PS_44_ISF1 TaxID=2974917 RepID=UPI0028DFA3D4|nr:enoyl-CoA hydratase/isomerase family protein [Amycolatopsis sp. PS_44_ISF1]MDT8915044.1 enoyl-CoA hydratase/isomerase family protein [Amycolatopsis sp. PS_44_ISF1]
MTIELELDAGIAVVTLDHGRGNTLDTATCRELVLQLAAAEAAGARAVVLTGAGSMFSAGVDLVGIDEGGAGYVSEFLPALSDAFLAVFGFPRPVVAALNGHAIAGGLVLAAACDHRVLTDGPARLGVTELLVGAPFPIAALEILRCAYGTTPLPGLIYSGAAVPGEDALARGLVDEIAPAGEVLGRARELAARLAELPAEAFAHTKAQLHRPYHERIAENQPSDDEQVERMWRSEAALAAVKSYVDRVLRS